MLKPHLSREQIKEIFLAHGFTVKDGQTDLKPYVYEAAEALLKADREQQDKAYLAAASWPFPTGNKQ